MLAIVIPYYKLSFFEETLQSLSNQTDKRFKVYIGDDASPQNPCEIIEKYKSKFDLEYYYFEKNLGGNSLTKQWGRCISLTDKEEWILLLGDDDYISPNFVEEFYNHLEKVNQLKINVIHFSVFIDKEGVLSKLFTHPRIESSKDNFFRKFFGGAHGSLSEQIFKKEMYLKRGFRNLPLAWGADDLAWLEFSDFGDLYGINEANTYFRISSENISRSGFQSEVKKETKNSLFKLIIDEYLYKFNKEQRLKLILHYQSLRYRYHKVSLSLFLKMCKLFLIEKEYKNIYKAARKLLSYYIKKWKR
ncbi:glycosyltransferase family A protein [uncultured Lutibacter sp.]|uniref:glycosyltransferase family 2 protein n=1 Tax=uncultured Lutibacter sp. TaxID=437739 RepID=UPI00260A49F3|nr:glycosyltransferase family A protein [uncultured Lutibacter sp.]